jgi:hypothetical protein
MDTAQKKQFVLTAAKSYPIKGAAGKRIAMLRDLVGLIRKAQKERASKSELRHIQQVAMKIQELTMKKGEGGQVEGVWDKMLVVVQLTRRAANANPQIYRAALERSMKSAKMALAFAKFRR